MAAAISCSSVVLARRVSAAAALLLSRARLSTASRAPASDSLTGRPGERGGAGEPRMGAGVNLPLRLWRSGEDLGEVEIQLTGGEVPHAELELEQELVRRLWATGGVPMENCTLGGDMDTMSGAGELASCETGGGAEIFRALEVAGPGAWPGNCLLGERGELAGEEKEDTRGLLSRAGLGTRPPAATATPSSSGSGPSMEPPLAELTPDMADTEPRSSPPRDATSELWMAA